MPHVLVGVSGLQESYGQHADKSLLAKSASPQELNRSWSAVVRTGAGIASSIAALIAQSPSEPETRPPNFARLGSCRRAAGTISQIARGLSSFLTTSASDVAIV